MTKLDHNNPKKKTQRKHLPFYDLILKSKPFHSEPGVKGQQSTG